LFSLLFLPHLLLYISFVSKVYACSNNFFKLYLFKRKKEKIVRVKKKKKRDFLTLGGGMKVGGLCLANINERERKRNAFRNNEGNWLTRVASLRDDTGYSTCGTSKKGIGKGKEEKEGG
jgi:hypothetical protein